MKETALRQTQSGYFSFAVKVGGGFVKSLKAISEDAPKGILAPNCVRRRSRSYPLAETVKPPTSKVGGKNY